MFTAAVSGIHIAIRHVVIGRIGVGHCDRFQARRIGTQKRPRITIPWVCIVRVEAFLYKGQPGPIHLAGLKIVGLQHSELQRQDTGIALKHLARRSGVSCGTERQCGLHAAINGFRFGRLRCRVIENPAPGFGFFIACACARPCIGEGGDQCRRRVEGLRFGLLRHEGIALDLRLHDCVILIAMMDNQSTGKHLRLGNDRIRRLGSH